jgi:hypothetical protein
VNVRALLLALVVAFPAQAAAPEELGLDLIPWSKKIGDRRYESPRDYEGTLKFFKDKFKGWKTVKWTREVALPTVKYIHVDNTNPDGKWAGINIYEMPNGRVRYYVLDRPKPATDGGPESDAPAKKKSGG